MKIGLGQINPTVGDLAGNSARIIDLIDEARHEKADLVVFPELCLTGYPPEDLLLKPKFIADNQSALEQVARAARGLAVFLGFVHQDKGALYNAAAFIDDGVIKEIYHKMHLPNYGVFDEKRYFREGNKSSVVDCRGQKIGLGICEDIWAEKGPYEEEVGLGADVILNINASPYHLGKVREREALLKQRAEKYQAAFVYVNLVGGQDELVFDGGSMVCDPRGRLIAACDQFREELLFVDLERDRLENWRWLEAEEEIYRALLTGLRDYVLKNGFGQVLLGLSGGIDSALTLALAAEALGKERVHAVFMPSQYTAEQSYRDARAVAANLGVELAEIPIKEVFAGYLNVLQPNFMGRPADLTEENLQARIRGNYLMALSNKFGWLVLATGNKSEMSTGYCTLYGDMAGGFAVLKDVPKTLVYQLANWLNKKRPVIPEAIIKRAPTAELKPGQTDQDVLPPYEVLDPIMQAYVEENKSAAEIAALGFDAPTVARVVALIDRSEYKRRQAPPGPRLTPRAFGKDWRLPITNHYKE
ncbi:MAG: NAD+ synthase [Candidatus Saganbacteria bacterium]|nr:NAD+ synthase [Candidatus Saganbacteria bacterium]